MTLDPDTEALGWLDRELGGAEAVGFAWVVLLAFLRLSTKVGLFPRPLSPEAALGTMRTWVGEGPGVVVQPTPRHLEVLASLVGPIGTGGTSPPTRISPRSRWSTTPRS